jgi:hypothetical protein
MPFICSVEYAYAFASQPIPFSLVTNGLVIQLDAYLVASYPGTGTSVFDITSGFTHTMTDSATYQTLYGIKTFNCTSNKILQCSVTGPTLPTSGYTNVCWGRVIISSATWRTSLSSPSTPVTTGVWYQIVGVWTNVASNSIALYKNGTLVGSSSHNFASIRNTTTPLYLGNYNGNEFAQQFDGDMGIVRIYSKVLSAAEVLNNYDANKVLYGLV